MSGARQLFFKTLVAMGIVVSTVALPASAMPQTEPSIIFASNRSGSTEIYASKRSGADIRQLTHNDIDEQTPAISPNGSSIAFTTSDEASADSTLSLLNINTGAVTTLSHWANTQYNSPVDYVENSNQHTKTILPSDLQSVTLRMEIISKSDPVTSY